ncbi:hypothetical protein PARMER_04203 [Parabacteroides merdae ATCC 43184]|nr:hypothetical protein PARMER_04203 [Parabacteroides merdae ATCC 43184]
MKSYLSSSLYGGNAQRYEKKVYTTKAGRLITLIKGKHESRRSSSHPQIHASFPNYYGKIIKNK